MMLWLCYGGLHGWEDWTGLGIWDIHMGMCVDGKEGTGVNCMRLVAGLKTGIGHMQIS